MQKVRQAKREVMMKLAFFPENHLCGSSQIGLALLLGASRAYGSSRTEQLGFAGHMCFFLLCLPPRESSGRSQSWEFGVTSFSLSYPNKKVLESSY